MFDRFFLLFLFYSTLLSVLIITTPCFLFSDRYLYFFYYFFVYYLYFAFFPVFLFSRHSCFPFFSTLFSQTFFSTARRIVFFCMLLSITFTFFLISSSLHLSSALALFSRSPFPHRLSFSSVRLFNLRPTSLPFSIRFFIHLLRYGLHSVIKDRDRFLCAPQPRYYVIGFSPFKGPSDSIDTAESGITRKGFPSAGRCCASRRTYRGHKGQEDSPC